MRFVRRTARVASIHRKHLLIFIKTLDPDPKSVALCARPAAARGAFRDRHERGRQDAMDALARKTNAAHADGEAVWSWRPDAGAKPGGG